MKRIALIAAAAILIFVAGAGYNNFADYLTADIPRMQNCEWTEQIFVHAVSGQKWPSGSVSGCRCTWSYNGYILIDYSNRDRTFCAGRAR